MRIYKGILVLAFMAALVPNVWGGIGAFLTALAVWAFVKRRDLEAWVGTGLTKKGKAKDSWLSGAVACCQEADPRFPRITAHALRHTAASL
jgi:integrase